MFKIYYD
jgi:hypothetical protein